MRTFLPKVSLFLVAWSFLAACGMETADYRKPKFENSLEAKAAKPNPVLINFTLPDRTAKPELAGLSGYYYRLLGEGADCPSDEIIEEAGTWDDANREIKFQVNGRCNYAVTVRYGVYNATALALAGRINWTDHIKPILDANCVSCAGEVLNYASFVQNAEDFVRQIEAGELTGMAALSPIDIAKILAWKDNGFEEASAIVPPSEKEKLLSAVYYENNRNDYMMSYEIVSRSTFELRRSLWIQPDGQTAGLSTKELSTWTPKQTTGTTP